MKSNIVKTREKINTNVINFFTKKFGTEELPIDYETCWPLSKWCSLQTATRSFIVELKFSTGKVLDIVEEF